MIVKYVRLYKPELAKYIVPIASPALTHAKFLKKTFGDDISVVFVGPCIAKKEESDTHKDLIDFALTYEEVKLWLKELDRKVEQGDCLEENFVPEIAYEGGLYPIDCFFEAHKIFATTLSSGKELHKENHKFNNKFYDMHVFPIEENISIGVTITDITDVSHSREIVAQKAKEVIDKNITTVQQIACLLGEHRVQTESILNTIASQYDQEDEE